MIRSLRTAPAQSAPLCIFSVPLQSEPSHLIWRASPSTATINGRWSGRRGARFVTVVITTCTNRKRKPVPETLRMAALPQADLFCLAENWSRRLVAERPRFRGIEIYGGRGFKEAVTASQILSAKLMVVSAGLGLIDGSTPVPPYACTVLLGARDSVSARVTGHFSATAWWAALNKTSPFSSALVDAAGNGDGLICAALSEAYIAMIAPELMALPASVLERLRLFTRAPLDRLPLPLRQFVMPYDDRLDGPDSPYRGTRSDFAGRALHHFAEAIGVEADSRSAGEHAVAVAAALAEWRMPVQSARVRYDDATMLNLIRANWDAVAGSSSRLLRRFRDELGIACEQGRFAQLAKVVRSERS